MSMTIDSIYIYDGVLGSVTPAKSLTKSLVLSVSLWTVEYYFNTRYDTLPWIPSYSALIVTIKSSTEVVWRLKPT
jgi:hypothetical protein